MAIDYESLGKRIAFFRGKSKISQGDLSKILDTTRDYISHIETGKKHPSLDTVTSIANALHISADDLLVDSLEYPSSTANTRVHKLLLECNPSEEDIIVRNAENLKALLYSHSVK